MGIESYNPSASLNTTLGGKNVAEGMARGDVSDSIRQLMADIASGVVKSVPAKAFGAVGNGSTDDLTPLTNFITSANANPGVPHVLDAKTYAVTAALPAVSVSTACLLGVGADIHDVGALMTGTVIKYTGSASASALLQLSAVSGASNQRLSNVTVQGIGLDCNGLIATGLEMLSARSCNIDVAVANATTQGVRTGVVASLGEARDCLNNSIRLKLRQVETPGGYCLVVDGDTGANTCFNDFWVEAQHKNVAALRAINCDNNQYRRFRSIRAGGGSATESVQLLGGATTAQRAREETFWHFSADQQMRAYGTADGFTVASSGHRLFSPDRDNSTPIPIIGAGAWIDCEYGLSFTPSVTGGGGAGLSITSPQGTYVRNGAFCDVEMTFTKAAGTSYTSLSATLPFACAGTIGRVSVGKERSGAGVLFSAFVDAASSTLVIQSVDGTTAIPNGNYNVSVRYRVR